MSSSQPYQDPKIGKFVTDSWKLYDHFKEVYVSDGKGRTESLIVVDSISVPLFGNLEAYQDSKRKVVTVGLNPSNGEFPSVDHWSKFPLVREHGHEASRITSLHIRCLSEYFQQEPYEWFNSYEPILQGMGVSFGDARPSRLGTPPQPNTALHTDLFSPLATTRGWTYRDPDPVFQKHLRTGRNRLSNDWVPVWHRLIRHLRPDVILISIAERYLASIEFKRLGEWCDIYVTQSKRGSLYRIQGVTLEVSGNSRPLLVFGKAGRRPFAGLGDSDKRAAGMRILDCLNSKAPKPCQGLPQPGTRVCVNYSPAVSPPPHIQRSSQRSG